VIRLTLAASAPLMTQTTLLVQISPELRVRIVQSFLDQPRIDSPVHVEKLSLKNKLSRGHHEK
jgi:hypothetical protein